MEITYADRRAAIGIGLLETRLNPEMPSGHIKARMIAKEMQPERESFQIAIKTIQRMEYLHDRDKEIISQRNIDIKRQREIIRKAMEAGYVES